MLDYEEFYDNQLNSNWKISKGNFVNCVNYCLGRIFYEGFELVQDVIRDEPDSVMIKFKDSNGVYLNLYIWIDDEEPIILVNFTNYEGMIEPHIYDYGDYTKELDAYLKLYLDWKKTNLNL